MAMFRDRLDAGAHLGEALRDHPALQQSPNLIVVGLPRGGVPVAAEVARILGAPLDGLVVRKLGVPTREELAMGAVGEDDVIVMNEQIVDYANLPPDRLAQVISDAHAEVRAQARRLRPRGHRPAVLDDATVLLVDDGVATGATARAAGQLARARGAQRVVLATPVAPYEVYEMLQESQIFDEVICRYSPVRFTAVGRYYGDFTQVTDEQVRALLEA